MQVKNFAVLFEQEKDGGYSVSVPSLPGCYSQGDTFEEALKNIQEAVDLYLEDEELPDQPVKEFLVPLETRQ
jgi:predicted RNase H-like HicB family nuclease